MAVSYYRYGAIAEGYPHAVDAIASMKQRIQAYSDTGNTEYLIDASNFLMIEFMCPSITDAHFSATDSDGSTGRISVVSKVSFLGNQEILR